MSASAFNDFFLFTIGKLSVKEIEQVIYQHSTLEDKLGEEWYIELISFDFKQEKASQQLKSFFLQHLFTAEELQDWLRQYFAMPIKEVCDFILDVFFHKPLLQASIEVLDNQTATTYFKKGGDRPHYELNKELGEAEEITVYYGYPKGGSTINNITLIFQSLLDIYYENLQGKDGLLEQALRTDQAQQYTLVADQVFSNVLDWFKLQLGEPIVDEKNEHGLFEEPHHQYQLYKWELEGNSGQKPSILFLMKYIDDRIWNQINYFMKINWLSQD